MRYRGVRKVQRCLSPTKKRQGPVEAIEREVFKDFAAPEHPGHSCSRKVSAFWRAQAQRLDGDRHISRTHSLPKPRVERLGLE